MSFKIALGAAALTLLLVAAVAPTASAHATAYSPDGKIKFVYGNLNEPAYTYTKTGLDLIISENKTNGAPISGLESVDHEGKLNPKIFVSFLYNGQELNITNGFKAQFGAPGKYTYPITYTKAGAYSIHIKGLINGTMVDQTIAPAHSIEDLKDSMWPDKVDVVNTQAQKITDLESQLATQKEQIKALEDAQAKSSAKSPGPDAALLVLGIVGLVAVLARRRTGA